MRVLHVLRADHESHVGGDLVQLRASVDALVDQGVDARAATMTDADFEPDVVHLYNLQRPRALHGDITTTRRRWPAARIVIAPVFWPWDLAGLLRTAQPSAWWRAAKSGTKARAAWLSCRRILRGADAVLPNSIGEGRRIERFFAVQGGPRWIVIPNGVWVKHWPQRPELARAATLEAFGLDPELEVLVACVARLEPQKNQRALVDAVARRQSTGLLLIGPWETTKYGRAVRTQVGRRLPGRAVCTGWLGQHDVAEALRGVDVHVLASYRETPGLASLEAAAIGCEIVVTAGGSTIEYFGPDAHVATSGRPASIAAAIDDAVRRPCQPALRRRVEAFDWSVAAAALRTTYESVLSNPPAAT